MVFGNKNMLLHLARGVGGFGALTGSFATMNTMMWPSVVLLPLSLLLLRGCPACWAVGLMEMLATQFWKRGGADVDHRPALAGPSEIGAADRA